MFADRTNLFSKWFEANTHFYDFGKRKYSLFHKPSKKGSHGLLFPKLLIKKQKVERVKSIKFYIFLDENLSWKGHIKYIGNKVTKSIDLLYRAKLFSDKYLLLTLCYSYIPAYLNWANFSRDESKQNKSTQSTKANNTNYLQLKIL